MADRGTPIGELSASYNRACELAESYADLLTAAFQHLGDNADRFASLEQHEAAKEIEAFLDEAKTRLDELHGRKTP